jgi:hypothetical protein
MGRDHKAKPRRFHEGFAAALSVSRHVELASNAVSPARRSRRFTAFMNPDHEFMRISAANCMTVRRLNLDLHASSSFRDDASRVALRRPGGSPRHDKRQMEEK